MARMTPRAAAKNAPRWLSFYAGQPTDNLSSRRERPLARRRWRFTAGEAFQMIVTVVDHDVEFGEMALEIERKFLVAGQTWKTAPGCLVRQGYLNRDPHCTVRIRVSGGLAWITIKGVNVGAARPEFEYSIPLSDGDALLDLCERPLLEKTRYRIQHDKHCWEVDEFHGDNAGLIVAEAELRSASEPLDLPEWIGAEVTGDPRYYCSNLVEHPYRQWSSKPSQ